MNFHNNLKINITLNFPYTYSKGNYKSNQWNILTIRSTIINQNLIRCTVTLYDWINSITVYETSSLPFNSINPTLILSTYTNFDTRIPNISPSVSYQYIRLWKKSLNDAILDKYRSKFIPIYENDLINTYYDFRFFNDLSKNSFEEYLTNEQITINDLNTKYSVSMNNSKLSEDKNVVVCGNSSSHILTEVWNPNLNLNEKVNTCAKNKPLFFKNNSVYLSLNIPSELSVIKLTEFTVEIWFSTICNFSLNNFASFLYNGSAGEISPNQLDLSIQSTSFISRYWK